MAEPDADQNNLDESTVASYAHQVLSSPKGVKVLSDLLDNDPEAGLRIATKIVDKPPALSRKNKGMTMIMHPTAEQLTEIDRIISDYAKRK